MKRFRVTRRPRGGVLSALVRSALYAFALLFVLLVAALLLDASFDLVTVTVTILTLVITFVLNWVEFEKASVGLVELARFLRGALLVVAAGAVFVYLVSVLHPQDTTFRITEVEASRIADNGTTVTGLFPEREPENAFHLVVDTSGQRLQDVRLTFVVTDADQETSACAANLDLFVEYNSVNLGRAQRGENSNAFGKSVALHGPSPAQLSIWVTPRAQSDPNCGVNVSVTSAKLTKKKFFFF